MIGFLLKGLMRDRSRSLLPLLVVTAGVMLTVLLYAWLRGAEASVMQATAHFSCGDLRLATRAYAIEADQMPNDAALLRADTLLTVLRSRFPDLRWTPRISFGGLLDIPNAAGETRVQAPIAGLGVDLFSPASPERMALPVGPSLVSGRAPMRRGEAVVSDELARRLGIRPGQLATVISSTMNGSMALANFTIVGTIRFGVAPMDHGTLIADLADVQSALDMQDAASVILGFFPDDLYHERRADAVAAEFNSTHATTDQFAPVMQTLRQASGLSDLMDYVGSVLNALIAAFVIAMSVVLWNAGLMGSLRRYGEIGIRLAFGEDTRHIYISMLIESLAIGVVGSAVGTGIGLAAAYALQVHGLDMRPFLRNSTMMVGDVLRARVTVGGTVIGFVPGLLAMLLGTAISGIGIYRRQTAQLFKELEA